MDRSSNQDVEENANLKRQLHQQREEIHLLQSRLRAELRKNTVPRAPRTQHHNSHRADEEALWCQRRIEDYIVSLEEHCRAQDEQLNQLKLRANTKLREAKDRVMTLEMMVLQRDSELANLERVLMAETTLYERMMDDVQHREERWRRKYAALDFNIREKKRRKREREEAFALLTQVAPSLEEDEIHVTQRRGSDWNTEGEEDQVVGLSEVFMHSPPQSPFYI